MIGATALTLWLIWAQSSSIFPGLGISMVSADQAVPGSASSGNDDSQNPYAVIPPGYTSPEIPYPALNRTYYHPSAKWAAAHAKAAEFLSGWTVEEKTKIVTGTGWAMGRCVGNTQDVPSRNWTGLCLEDSPLGVRFADYVSAFPAGINAASTFDKDLIYARGYAMGEEFKGKGVHIALGPMTNMGRVAAGGRNWEGFGGDPYLSGIATEMTIRGMQDAGVQATVKHYIGNEQERNRTTSSSNIDDRTMREIYTHPFLRAVQADVASVMCSYNLVNGSWACQNSKTLNGILKTDFGFQGYVMSDWTATHSGVLAVNNGEDMDMPGDVTFGSLTSFFGQNLTTAVGNGSVKSDRLDDMAQRVMAGYFLLGQDQGYPAVNFDAFRRTAEANNSHVDVRGEHHEIIKHMGAASTVLLKNVNNTLPLSKPKSIGVFGSDMGPSPKGPNGFGDRGGDLGTLAMGWGSGTADFPILVDPLSAISHQAQLDRSVLEWWFNDWDTWGMYDLAGRSEVCIVGINSDSGEQYITVDGNEGDRNNLTAWNNGDDVVNAIANHSSNVIVVVHSVGPMDMEAWIDHPNVTAVLWAGLPGQESGNSLVDVLYGKYNPSGRLPYTIAKNRKDYPADIIYVNSSTPAEPLVDYTEGLNIDYRHFLAQNITPRYPFGFGMSYTSFNHSNLQIEKVEHSKRSLEEDEEMERYYEDAVWEEEKRDGAPGTYKTEEASDSSDAEGTSSTSSTSSISSTSSTSSTSSDSSDSSISSTSATSTSSANPANSTMSTNSNNSTSSTNNPTSDEDTTAPSTKVGSFLRASLHKPRWQISIDIQNVGSIDGCDIPQLYLSYPPSANEPPRVLRDFARVNLQPWQTQTVSFKLSNYDVSIWDVVTQKWVIPEGKFGVIVAKDSVVEGVSGEFCPSGKGC